MARHNKLLKRSSSHANPGSDRVVWMNFYKDTDKLVEHEMQQALMSDVQAALHLVESIHQDHWSW